MFKLNKIDAFTLLIFTVFLIPKSLLFAQTNESITITTYYPSPYGSYDKLQTYSLGVGDNNGSGGLDAVDIPTVQGDVWIAGKVGIGTTNPEIQLQITSASASGILQDQLYLDNSRAYAGGGNFGSALAFTTSEGGTQFPSSRVLGRIGAIVENAGLNITGALVFGTRANVGGFGTVLEKVRITSDGRVGIGTTSPAFVLEAVKEGSSAYIVSTGYSNSQYTGGFLHRHARGTKAAPLISQAFDCTGWVQYMGYDGSTFQPCTLITSWVDGNPGAGSMPGRFDFATTPSGSAASLTRMTIRQDGNIGIGGDIGTGWPNGSRPVTKLQIDPGTISSPTDIFSIGTNPNTGGYTALILGLSTRSGGYPYIRAVSSSGSAWGNLILNDGGGAVGIGTTDIWGKLAIQGTYNGTAITIRPTASEETAIQWCGTGGCTYITKGGTDNSLYFGGTPNGLGSQLPTMTVQANGGNVGIGTQNPGAYRLYVTGNAYATGQFIDGGNSDIRLKMGIETLSNDTLERILKLRGVKFEWRRNEFKDRGLSEGKQIGMIAQEIEKQFPELVNTGPDGYKGIAYDRFTAVLLEAIKAQQQQIDAQQKEIEDLKSEFARIKK